ncbi:heterokaryon incompatibility protein-domain-containing protein, partial [Immersiella caudata]
KTRPVPGLRVIDCVSLAIVDAPNDCQYFALSYVWGSRQPAPSHATDNGYRLRACQIPAVIRDAILVTLALGFRFLWVDQFCIDQNDGPQKLEQIAQMDKIYSRAALTLVAAAGDSASYGLPGVSRPRLAQKVRVVSGVAMIQIFRHTHVQLTTSKWATRDWTFQEFMLSPRRLIFAEDQISFVCNTSHYAETVKRPLDPPSFQEWYNLGVFAGMIPTNHISALAGGEIQLKMLWLGLTIEQLKNYTSRELSHPQDALNAVMGLFNWLEPQGIRQVHGIPMKRLEGNSSLLSFSIQWSHMSPGTRRHPFPSWSWAGWRGGIHIHNTESVVPRDCRVDLVGIDGRIVSLQGWFNQQESMAERSELAISTFDAAPILQITTLAVSLGFEERSWAGLRSQRGREYIDGLYAVLPIREGITAMAYVFLDDENESLPLEGDILGLALGTQRSLPKRGHEIHAILVVR